METYNQSYESESAHITLHTRYRIYLEEEGKNKDDIEAENLKAMLSNDMAKLKINVMQLREPLP